MKILFVNKFLYEKAGAETYMFQLARELCNMGNKAVYFGMSDERNSVNFHRDDINMRNKDFHGAGLFEKLRYPFGIIYSFEARKKIRKLLEEEKPDIAHLNNINFQITPSIIYELKRFNIPIVMTIHDANLICPNHSLYNYEKNEICTLCMKGGYGNCIRTGCIHGSKAKSIIGYLEGLLYRTLKTYYKIDTMIFPSMFMADMFRDFGFEHRDMRVIRNFSPRVSEAPWVSEASRTTEAPRTTKAPNGFGTSGNSRNAVGYVLYFGRLCISKGLDVLVEAAERLPGITFVVAGEGDYAGRLAGHKNIIYRGFLSGDELKECISRARISIVPSNWHENCSMTILESKSLGIPVIASDTGGNPEIVRDGTDGFLFKRGNSVQLAVKIEKLYNDGDMLRKFSRNSRQFALENSLEQYAKNIFEIYCELLTKGREGA